MDRVTALELIVTHVSALQPIIVTRGTCLRLQVWRCLLMAEVTLESLVKVSPSTTRMWPSSSRTQDTDLTIYSTVQ